VLSHLNLFCRCCCPSLTSSPLLSYSKPRRSLLHFFHQKRFRRLESAAHGFYARRSAFSAFHISVATMKIHRVDLHKYFHYGSFHSFIFLPSFPSLSFSLFLSRFSRIHFPFSLCSFCPRCGRYSSTIGYVAFN